MGRYWKGSAWDFVPDLLSYQYGLLEGKRLIACHQKLLQLTEEKFVSTLQRIDLKENYPSFGARLEPEHVKWILEAFRQLNRNVKRAIEKGLPLFYMLD